MGKLNEAFLAQATEAFAAAINQDRRDITRNIRRATIRSTQTVDVSNYTANPYDLKMFLSTDEGDAAKPSGWAVVTDEPQLLNGQPTPSDIAYAIIAHRFHWNSQQIFGSDPTEVNSINGILTKADARIIQGGAVVAGPVTLGDHLEGERSMRVSSATTAGELLGGVEGEAEYAFEPSPIYVPPTSTVDPRIRFNGAEFATGRSPAVTADFKLSWQMTVLVANVSAQRAA